MRTNKRATIFVTFGCSVALVVLGLAVSAMGQNAGTDRVPTISFLPERSLMTGGIVYRSGTMLARTRNHVFGSIHTSGLVPGNVYTGWFAFFNNPEQCLTRPCSPADIFGNPAAQGSLVNFGGRVVGADGVASFAEDRAVGDATNAFIGPGLLDPRRAEIHLAVRHHGPASADPAILAQQLTMFYGGCPPNACTTVQAAVHAP